MNPIRLMPDASVVLAWLLGRVDAHVGCPFFPIHATRLPAFPAAINWLALTD